MTDELVPRVEHHRGGTVSAKGHMLDEKLHGYWEWYRADGTRKRSGHFNRGEQVGEWVTYDTQGSPYKTTQMPDPT